MQFMGATYIVIRRGEGGNIYISVWQDLCKGPKEGPKLKLKSQIPFAYGSIFP